jgi:hypothetical protein
MDNQDHEVKKDGDSKPKPLFFKKKPPFAKGNSGKFRGKPGKKGFFKKGPKRPPAPSTESQLRRKAIEKVAEKLQVSLELATHVHDKKLTPEAAVMLYELGLYKKDNYTSFALDSACQAGTQIHLRLHGDEDLLGKIIAINPYDLLFELVGGEQRQIIKLHIKYFYLPEHVGQVKKFIKKDESIVQKGFQPIQPCVMRNHVKNKVLYPLQKNKEVLFFSTLDGDLIRGIVGGFNRYEILILMKGGTPLHLLRHAIFNVCDKDGKNSYLKPKKLSVKPPENLSSGV